MQAKRTNRRLHKPAYEAKTEPPARHISNRPVWGKRVYAIAFDLDTETLARMYRNSSPNNGYADIARVLAEYGFARQQGSVYFGDDTVDSVRCVIAIQEVAKRYPWFTHAVSDVRMLRIEENNDLGPALAPFRDIFPEPPAIAAE